jgi:hypothetical protein
MTLLPCFIAIANVGYFVNHGLVFIAIANVGYFVNHGSQHQCIR